MYIYKFSCLYISICLYVYTKIFICVFLSIYLHVFKNINLYIHLYVHIYIFIYRYLFLCMYLLILLHICYYVDVIISISNHLFLTKIFISTHHKNNDNTMIIKLITMTMIVLIKITDIIYKNIIIDNANNNRNNN